MRTKIQKELGKIVRNTKIASWQKCEQIEKLFNYDAEETICKNCGKKKKEHLLGKDDFGVNTKWCDDSENSNKFEDSTNVQIANNKGGEQ